MITDGTTPLGILAFLGLAGGTLLAALMSVIALGRRRMDQVRLAAGVTGFVWASYGLVLTATSALSTERVLGLGEEKHICEIDCHVAYTVTGVRSAFTIEGRTAAGTFYIVSLYVRFDAATISAHRGMAPLTPGPRIVEVRDQAGRVYTPLPQSGASSLERSLVPGQGYATTLLFDLPTDIHNPRLFIGAQSGWPDRLVIGSENSLWHGKTLFRLS